VGKLTKGESVPVLATGAAQPDITDETGITAYSDIIRGSFTGKL
jgi:hypothetical protein